MNLLDQVRCRCLHREPVRKPRDLKTIEEDFRRAFADVEDEKVREAVERVIEVIRRRQD